MKHGNIDQKQRSSNDMNQRHELIASPLLQPVMQFLQCTTPEAWVERAKRPESLPVLLLDHLMCELKAAQTAMLLLRKYALDDIHGQALLEWLAPYEDFVYRGVGQWQDLKQYNRLFKTVIASVTSDNCTAIIGTASSNALQNALTPSFKQDIVNKMVLLIKEELHHFYQVLEWVHHYQIPIKPVTSSRYAKGLLSRIATHEPATLIDKLICGAYIEARSCERFAQLAPYLPPALGDFYVSLLRSEARHFEDYLHLAGQLTPHSIDERIRTIGRREAELISSSDQEFRFHSGSPTAVS